MTLIYTESHAKRIGNLDKRVDLLVKRALLDSENSPVLYEHSISDDNPYFISQIQIHQFVWF